MKDIKVGNVIIADGGFTCLADGQTCVVRIDRDGDLYVTCQDGCHYLDGQVDENDIIVGFEMGTK